MNKTHSIPSDDSGRVAVPSEPDLLNLRSKLSFIPHLALYKINHLIQQWMLILINQQVVAVLTDISQSDWNNASRKLTWTITMSIDTFQESYNLCKAAQNTGAKNVFGCSIYQSTLLFLPVSICFGTVVFVPHPSLLWSSPYFISVVCVVCVVLCGDDAWWLWVTCGVTWNQPQLLGAMHMGICCGQGEAI